MKHLYITSIFIDVTHDIRATGDRPIVDPPVLSQITCLGGPSDNTEDTNTARNNLQRKDETSFVKLCREGGHKGKVLQNSCSPWWWQ